MNTNSITHNDFIFSVPINGTVLTVLFVLGAIAVIGFIVFLVRRSHRTSN